MKIREKLKEIQVNLHAPKSQFNSFGKYKYRNLEDILTAVKPLLEKLDCELIISDEIVVLGDRFYVKATATLLNGDGEISVTAYARETENKKGMDQAQITGAASSYARKYALNGLFCIDDTADSDSQDNRPEAPTKKDPKKISDEGINDINNMLALTDSDEEKFLKAFKVTKVSEMTEADYKKAMEMFTAKINKKKSSPEE